MTPELVIADMLNVAAITALVNDRIACSQLPQNTTYPALIYQVISCVPQPHLNVAEPQLVQARVQINPIAETISTVKKLHEAINVVMAWQANRVVAGKQVVVCRPDTMGALERDEELGLWTQHKDYILLYYE